MNNSHLYTELHLPLMQIIKPCKITYRIGINEFPYSMKFIISNVCLPIARIYKSPSDRKSLEQSLIVLCKKNNTIEPCCLCASL